LLQKPGHLVGNFEIVQIRHKEMRVAAFLAENNFVNALIQFIWATIDIVFSLPAKLWLDVQFTGSNPLHDFGIAMIEEAAFLPVQRRNGPHILGSQFEVENGEVFSNPLLVHRFRYDHYASLDQPTQHHLSNGFAMFAADGSEQFVAEQVVFALGKGAPGFDLNTVFLKEPLGLDLLTERMRFYLVDCRCHLVVNDEIHDPVRLEIADADRTDFAFPTQLFHGPPGTVDIAVRLMDQIQIQIIQLQPGQRFIERLPGSFVARILDPELGGDKELMPGHAATPDRVADGFFIHVRRRRINRSIARLQGTTDAAFTFL